MEAKYRVSLEIAKQLKEADFPQDGDDAYWSEHYNGKETSLIGTSQSFSKYRTYYAAPCVGKLGEELAIAQKNMTDRQLDAFLCRIVDCLDSDKGEINARALLWLELKKKGLI